MHPSLLHASMGMVTESAEIIDLIKKHVGYKRPLNREKLKLELGDQLYYLTLAIISSGFSIEEIIDSNINKLSNRYPSGYSDNCANNRKGETNEREN